MMLNDLADIALEDVFDELGRARDEFPENSHMLAALTEACRVRGSKAALSWIGDRRTREAIAAGLYRSRATWWIPQEIWAGLPNALRETQMFP